MPKHRTIKLSAVVVASVALAVAVMSPAAAAIPTRVTEGEAHAVFESQFTGGFAIANNPAGPVAAPVADELVPVVMSPISSSPDDPFCVLDWHVIRVLLGSDVREDLADSDVHIWLDDAPLDLVKTAIKPLVQVPGIYTRGYGVVVPPGTPAAGLHTLAATLDFFDGTSEDDQTTVNVNSADSPACAGS
jgi:hypothetical protein